MLAYRHAQWALLDLQRKYEVWAEAVGNADLARCLYRTALDLADARQGALFVVLREPADTVRTSSACPIASTSGSPKPAISQRAPTRRDLLYLLTGRTVTELEPSVLAALASLDGATVTDPHGNLIAVGAILRHPYTESLRDDAIVEGARTHRGDEREPVRSRAEGQ